MKDDLVTYGIIALVGIGLLLATGILKIGGINVFPPPHDPNKYYGPNLYVPPGP